MEKRKNMDVMVFGFVSGQLHPSFFQGLSQKEVMCVMENVNAYTPVQWTPTRLGVLVTGTIKELEIAKDLLEKEVHQIRSCRNISSLVNQCSTVSSPYIVSNTATRVSTGTEVGAVACAKGAKERKNEDRGRFTMAEPRPIAVKHNAVRRTPACNSRELLNYPEKRNEIHSPGQELSACIESKETNGVDYLESEHFTCVAENVPEGQQSNSSSSFCDNGTEMMKNGGDVEFAANLLNMVLVKVVQGDLTNYPQADVIVNPCSGCLQNTSGIGASLIDTGGLAIQIELNETLGCQRSYPPGKVIRTSAGALPSSKIFHVVCPQWHSTFEDASSKALHAALLECLSSFSQTRMKTIAFPSFSCPFFPIPEDTCARLMIQAVTEISASNLESQCCTPISVHFVLYHNSTLKIFQNEIKQWINSKKGTKITLSKADEAFMEETGRNEKERGKCPVCLGKINHEATTLEKCRHTFCKVCLESAFQVKKICPVCKLSYGVMTGNQPDGTMTYSKEESSLPGFRGYGTIVINYRFRGGIQGAKHPNPGQRYSGTSRTAYLPDSREGNDVLAMLKRAFDDRLIFQIGTSLSSGAKNQITWNDIEHKTAIYGGERNFGYPDADYLLRVQEQLASKGIYS